MNAKDALLESWDRQCKIIDNLAAVVSPELLRAKPSEDGWTVAFHLCHIHSVRRYWHMNAAGLSSPVGPSLFDVQGENWIPSEDIGLIRERLRESGALVRSFVDEQITAGSQAVGNYDHPVLYLQHMIWHEGWHAGLLMLAFRVAGHEPTEAWECANIWDEWRLPD